MENVVPRVSVPLLYDHHLRPQQLGLYSCPETTGPRPNDHHPCALARLAPVVTLLGAPLVQLGPQRLRLPCLQLGLQLGVEVRQLVRLQPQNFAEIPGMEYDESEQLFTNVN